VIRLGVAISSMALGGFELACVELLRRLDRRTVSTRIYAFRPGPLAADAEAAGIPVRIEHDKPTGDRSWTRADTEARRSYVETLAGALRRDDVSLLLVWGWIDGVTAGTQAGIPAIVERVDGPSLAGRVRDKSACARVICESRAVARVLRAQRTVLRLDPRRLAVIPNGVDLERFDPDRTDRAAARAALGIDADAFVVGSVARLAREKHLDLLIDALPLVRRRSPSAADRLRLVLCGPDSGERDALLERARRAGLEHVVLVLDARPDVAEVLAAFDVFALPSLYEGTPFALLEAMAMGLPVLCTPVGAVPDIVDGNGYLVPPLDPNATALAIEELLGDERLRSRLGARSRVLSRRYDVRHMVDAYARLFEQVSAEAEARS
jgi:glycosyltransferase involved in cell wall biosynthesis